MKLARLRRPHFITPSLCFRRRRGSRPNSPRRNHVLSCSQCSQHQVGETPHGLACVYLGWEHNDCGKPYEVDPAAGAPLGFTFGALEEILLRPSCKRLCYYFPAENSGLQSFDKIISSHRAHGRAIPKHQPADVPPHTALP